MKTLLTGSAIFLKIAGVILAGYFALLIIIFFTQRRLIFFPSHTPPSGDLKAWVEGQHTIGYCYEVGQPRTVWLMTHGNGGQASQRAYVLPRLAEGQSLYILEYPGYGNREGLPSKSSMNEAAQAAYYSLRQRFPRVPICVLGESIGSGPACSLCTLQAPPDKIVLVVPFDKLKSVAAEQMPSLPVRLMLRDNWDNIEALQKYRGQVEIYGAIDDRVIPFHHAKNLSEKVSGSKFTPIEGGHNDWSMSDQIVLSFMKPNVLNVK